MGTTFGAMYYAYWKSPDTAPKLSDSPSFDPNYGFGNSRQIREIHATEDEMEAAGLTLEQRDYCAHHLIAFLKCKKDNFPWVAACKDLQHHWHSCEFEDFVLRMKEYEREKRLLERAKRKGELRKRDE